MKKGLGKFFVGMMAAVLYTSASIAPIWAGEVTRIALTGKGSNKNIEFKESETFPLGGLFANFEEVYPGDVREQNIVLANEGDVEASFYLVMEEAEKDTQGKDTLDLIKALIYDGLLHLQLTNGSTILYEDVFGQNPSHIIEMGTLKPNHEAELNLLLTVDEKMGNEYQDLIAKVDWVIEARWIDDGGGTNPNPNPEPEPDPKPEPKPDPEEEIIPEEELPGGEILPNEPLPGDETIPNEPLPGDETIPDEPLPGGETIPDEPLQGGEIPKDLPEQRPLPKTGDSFPVVVIGGVGIAFGAVAIFLLVDHKKRINK
jgi:hypothetical protein